MKKEVIITGKTVEEALASARTQYSDENDVEYEILELPKKGFLGFGASPAKVKVTINDGEDILSELKLSSSLKLDTEEKPAPAPAPKPQQQQQQRPAQQQQQAPRPAQQSSAVPQPKPTPKPQNQTPQPKPTPKPAPQQPQRQQQKPAASAVKTPDTDAPAQRQAPAQSRPPRQHTPRPPMPEENEPLTQTELDMAVSFIKMVLAHMDMSETITVTPCALDEKKINLEGESSGILIGHHGETLDALQYLVNLHISRKANQPEEGEKKFRREYVKIVIDIEGYRMRREETLRTLAKRMAERALKYKKNIFLEPMNPYERRIIHSEIQQIEGVSTHSIGSDENRKIVITVNGLQRKKKEPGDAKDADE